METKSNPRARKAERQLKIFVTSSQALSPDLVKLIEKSSQARTTRSLGDADIILNIRDGKFFFSGLSSAISFQIPSLPLTYSNLASSFSLLRSHLSPPTFDRTRRRKEILREFQKTASVEKRICNSLIKDSNFEFSGLYTRRDELDAIYERTQSISQFPQAILELPSFRLYQTCQLLIHERGKQVVESYAYHRNGIEQQRQLNMSKFNTIHSMIKKSKNRLFQAGMLEDDTLLVGTFLARDFSLEGHTIIFMVSRNDFLPPSAREQELFFDFCNLLSPLFTQLMSIEQIENKNRNLFTVLDNINRALVVYDKQDKQVFANAIYTHSEEEFSAQLHKQFIPFSLSSRQKLFLHKYDMSEVTSQLFHFQRITLLGELLNTLQHELSNPLFGIRLSGELLEQECQDAEAKEVIQEINAYTKRCQTIIENFSYLYKDEHRSVEVDLKKLIAETVILTKSETRNIIKNIELPEEQLLILSNPTWITQILFNLIINSSQAIKEYWGDRLSAQRITIGAERAPTSIRLWVEDTGPGISAPIAEKLFTPFQTTKANGTGLGLSICRNLSHKLKAQLNFENKLNGQGARFILELPLNSP